MRVTASNLVRAIQGLPKDRVYNYVHSRNKGLVKIIEVVEPEGPVKFKRWPTKNAKTEAEAKIETISSSMIWRMANSIEVDKAFNVDRIYGASYNTRSVLEALIAHTPDFYACRPLREQSSGSTTVIKSGHKHLAFKPDLPHKNGVIEWVETDIIVKELFAADLNYGPVELKFESPVVDFDIDLERKHAQIQIALVIIGEHLNFRTWVAQNDRSIVYDGEPISGRASVIERLSSENLLQAFPTAAAAAKLIDCVWFKNGKLMPAVMEVEHSTGVTSGLTRMKKFKDEFLDLGKVRWCVVAPDEKRTKVFEEANKAIFRDLETKFFSYSAVEELFWLCERRKLKGVTEEFLDCFMEECVTD